MYMPIILIQIKTNIYTYKLNQIYRLIIIKRDFSTRRIAANLWGTGQSGDLENNSILSMHKITNYHKYKKLSQLCRSGMSGV